MEDLVESLSSYYDQEEINYFLEKDESSQNIDEYLKLKIDCFLREIVTSLKSRIEKDEDMKSLSSMTESMMNSGDDCQRELD